ncbi:uncharacterized protein [Spinacia oleracea]|uniref:Aminotransferase-like plant mobile domain-containing protein n=1 Tax=Spinacia oleracea TaxID=3562 RepID=A0ABM3RQH1_SPIOL|nr:uncharacterized protein LOC130471641 [Spinacia oleracea]
MDAIRSVGISAEQRVWLFLLALVSRVMAPSRNSRVHIGFLSALQDLRAVLSLNWGGMTYGHLLYEMKWASRTAPGSEPSIAALWSVLEIWMYEHFPTLAPDRTGNAAYPYAASSIGAVRRRVPLPASRRAWRILTVSELPELFALVIRYDNSGGEQVEVTILVAPPPHRRSYDAAPEHYAAVFTCICLKLIVILHLEIYLEFCMKAPRVRVCRWMLLIDSLKRHCAKLTQKLSGRDREERRRGRRGFVDREPQAETSLRQEGPSLDLGQGSSAGTFERHSDAERGAAPFVHADPTRHPFGGASSSRPFVPPPRCYFGGSGPQPWGADAWSYWSEMERMRQAQMFGAPYQFMAMSPPYQYPSSQQGVYPSPGTLRISE